MVQFSKDSNKKAPPPSSTRRRSCRSKLLVVHLVQSIPIRPHQLWNRVEDEGRSHVDLHWCQINRFVQYRRLPLVPRVDVHSRRSLHLDPSTFVGPFVVHCLLTMQFITAVSSVQFFQNKKWPAWPCFLFIPFAESSDRRDVCR